MDLNISSTSGAKTQRASEQICTVITRVLHTNHTNSQLLHCRFVNLCSFQDREFGGVKIKAQLLFCRVPGACRRTRWKKRLLLLIHSLMRQYEIFSFLWRFALTARQVALHSLWDFMNEWAHYQYEKLLKYLVKTDLYLQGGMYPPRYVR